MVVVGVVVVSMVMVVDSGVTPVVLVMTQEALALDSVRVEMVDSPMVGEETKKTGTSIFKLHQSRIRDPYPSKNHFGCRPLLTLIRFAVIHNT